MKIYFPYFHIDAVDQQTKNPRENLARSPQIHLS
jgi:hypothetical protein